MNFRVVTMGTALALFAASLAAQVKPAMIGFISVSEPELSLRPFREGMRELGYREGRDFSVEARFTDSTEERLNAAARGLAALDVKVLIAGGSDATRAAIHATHRIPIVMTQTSDALRSGFVSNLAHPGSNVTGITSFAGELGAKRLQLLKELLPGAKRIAVTWSRSNPSHEPGLRVVERAAAALGMEIVPVQIASPDELPRAFDGFAISRPDAVFFLPDNMIVNERGRVVQLAAKSRLPAMYWRKEFVEAGGLIAYGADNLAEYRQAAMYVDKILKGAKPGDLAVEQVSRYEMFVSLRAAREMNLLIPDAVLLRADRVIE